jgi:DNA-3-methyladenine glycosylase
VGSRLPRSFYARPTRAVARELLGKILVFEGRAVRIVETEAYLGLRDPASHAFRGSTPRTRPMFGPAGRSYVYLSHGVYPCMNVVTEGPGVPGAVLLRGAEPVDGVADDPRRLAGPGLLCLAMGITTAQTDRDLVRSGLTIRDAPAISPRAISKGPRIGIADSETVQEPWRYWITGSPGISRR